LANQRVSVKEASGESWEYEYDPIGQLVSGERTNNSGALIDQYTYLFDDIGNRQKVMESGKDTDYETNLLNQYKSSKTRSKPNRVTRFRHDPDGNLLEDAIWRYEWNGENRLVAMEAKDASKRLEFRYDSQGRRISKKVLEPLKRKTSWKEESAIHFIYDGWNILAELDAGGKLVRSHLWGLDVSGSPQGAGGVGGLIASRNHEEGASAYALYDGIGNVIQYVDTDLGGMGEVMKYDPFGNVTRGNDGRNRMHSLRFGFSTKYVDIESRHNYYGFRYYNPETGRWLNRDPIEEKGGLNVYGIVSNNTANSIDVGGLWESALFDIQGFFTWLLNPVSGMYQLEWEFFDTHDQAVDILKLDWIDQNRDALITFCNQATVGLSVVENWSDTQVSRGLFSGHPWISQWTGEAYKHLISNKLYIDKDCVKCVIELDIYMTAFDTANFNEGDSFGGDVFQDDWFIWIQDHSPFGQDYDIYATTTSWLRWVYEY
jgi:RHS repeat-associated protein